MPQSLTWWRGLVLSVIALCLVLAMTASGQNKQGAMTLATVDVEKVNAEFLARKAIETQMHAIDVRMQAALTRRNTMPFLSEEEHKQIDAIEEKETKTPDDIKKSKELSDKGARLSTEIDALRATADDKLTPEQKERLKKAETDFQTAKTAFEGLREQFRQTMQKQIDENSEKLMQRFRDAAKKVAEAKGIAMLFNSQVAPYAGTDLTQAVIAELNKNPK